jgi:hypothetical protein
MMKVVDQEEKGRIQCVSQPKIAVLGMGHPWG